MSAPDRGEMLDRADKALSIRRQCGLLCVARSGVSRAKRPANDNDLILMRRIDELFMAYPFYGSRRMTLQLRSEGHDINRKRVQRIMRTMGIVALGPKPNTAKPAPGRRLDHNARRDAPLSFAQSLKIFRFTAGLGDLAGFHRVESSNGI